MIRRKARAPKFMRCSAAFFIEPPTKELLRVIATGSVICNDEPVSDFCRAWRALQQAAAQSRRRGGEGGVRCGVYRDGTATGNVVWLVLRRRDSCTRSRWRYLRDDLTKMGFARRGDRHESEDHVSALCDVMRIMITGDGDTSPAALELQRDFFRRHIAPWYAQLCAAIIGANQTGFYKHVAHVHARIFCHRECSL